MNNFCKYFDDCKMCINTVDDEYYMTAELYFTMLGIVFVDESGCGLIHIPYNELNDITLILHHPKKEGCDCLEKNEESCER